MISTRGGSTGRIKSPVSWYYVRLGAGGGGGGVGSGGGGRQALKLAFNISGPYITCTVGLQVACHWRPQVIIEVAS